MSPTAVSNGEEGLDAEDLVVLSRQLVPSLPVGLGLRQDVIGIGKVVVSEQDGHVFGRLSVTGQTTSDLENRAEACELWSQPTDCKSYN